MRRLIIIRKDLHLTPGKLAAMVGHCCEAYWTNLLKRDYQFHKDNHGFILEPTKENIVSFQIALPKDIWNEYVNGIFTKTICEAKNINELKKAEVKAKEFGLVEQEDWGYINDCCLTELKPENLDGTTTVGIWFKPLKDDIVHAISKKFKLYGVFDKKRNCDVYRDYESVRNAYLESSFVTKTNGDMMRWMLEPYMNTQEVNV